MKYFILVIVSFYSLNGAKDLRSNLNNVQQVLDEDFPFLLNVDATSKREFSDILFSWNTTITQKISLLDAWALKQTDDVKVKIRFPIFNENPFR